MGHVTLEPGSLDVSNLQVSFTNPFLELLTLAKGEMSVVSDILYRNNEVIYEK